MVGQSMDVEDVGLRDFGNGAEGGKELGEDGGAGGEVGDVERAGGGAFGFEGVGVEWDEGVVEGDV